MRTLVCERVRSARGCKPVIDSALKPLLEQPERQRRGETLRKESFALYTRSSTLRKKNWPCRGSRHRLSLEGARWETSATRALGRGMRVDPWARAWRAKSFVSLLHARQRASTTGGGGGRVLNDQSRKPLTCCRQPASVIATQGLVQFLCRHSSYSRREGGCGWAHGMGSHSSRLG